MKRPPLHPISTWIAGGAMLVILLIAIAQSIGAMLVWLGLFALGTGIYVAVSRRRSWARLPASRPVGALVLGVGLVVMITGAAVLPASSATTTASPRLTSFSLRDWSGSSARDAQASLTRVAHRLEIVTEDGSAAPADLTGWVVSDEDPAPGTVVRASQRIVLTVRPAVTPTPSHTARPSASPTPTPSASASETSTPAPAPVAPAPAPAAPVAPAPKAPAPAPAPPAPAPAPATGPVIPGAFCPDADNGKTGVAANGRTYTCGGKGPDANGHLHWNS